MHVAEPSSNFGVWKVKPIGKCLKPALSNNQQLHWKYIVVALKMSYSAFGFNPAIRAASGSRKPRWWRLKTKKAAAKTPNADGQSFNSKLENSNPQPIVDDTMHFVLTVYELHLFHNKLYCICYSKTLNNKCSAQNKFR